LYILILLSMHEIVQRFAEQGYQLNPLALEIINSHPIKEMLIKSLLSSLDKDVAVIEASHISSLERSIFLSSEADKHLLKDLVSQCQQGSLELCKSHSIVQNAGLTAPHVEVGSDITGCSTCVGKYDDFVRYFRDRYAKLSEILAGRINARPIESLGKHTSGREVSIIGLVMDVRTTPKGNRIVELEDPTGMISAIIKNDSEIYDRSSFILPDEVLGVTGVSDGNGRLFLKNLIWPELPNQNQALEKGSGYALLLSDLHVGSKFFLEDAWWRFVSWLNGDVDDPSELASKVEYIVVAGDVADGIGIYPGQESDLAIKDIYEQYRQVGECFNGIRQGIQIVISPGNHDMVRQAEPQPAFPEIIQKFFRNDFIFVGNPAWIRLSSVPLLVYHGRSIDDLVLRIPGLSYATPEKAMVEMLRRRHLSPIYGSRVSIAPESEDHYVISRLPAILHCGHVHTLGIARYRGVAVINSGTWQSQTEFQKKMNVHPTPAAIPIVDLSTLGIRKLLFA
jgi:DNA polymerase II small subunit